MRETKYGAIAASLRASCASLPDGSQLPSEKDLATEFVVSIMTVRRALELLDEEGIVRRVFGRGTFVQRRVVAKGDQLTSFSEDMQMRGLRPSSRLLGIDVIKAPEDVRKDLHLGDGEKVVVLERLRLADDEPMCIESAHLSARFGDLLQTSGLEGSLHRLLAEHGYQLESAVRRIRAVVAEERQALLLGLHAGDPMLRVTQIFSDRQGVPIQRSCSDYRADRYEAFTKVRRHTEGADQRP
jgi:GntR family transcriptional regulator